MALQVEGEDGKRKLLGQFVRSGIQGLERQGTY